MCTCLISLKKKNFLAIVYISDIKCLNTLKSLEKEKKTFFFIFCNEIIQNKNN